ncbi:MAG: hypothetical protein NW214_08585 [Pseudanabaenaceae cyanobacterium bins.39]|nr:hypothetical protein [Pseudanabaenaceae cyanobacterium bins.39]
MTPEEIDSKFADHDRWFAEMRELTLANTTAIQRTADLANSNARVIQSLCDLAAEDREERQAIIARTDEMLADIRGLQAENRRILDILLNQQQRDQE